MTLPPYLPKFGSDLRRIGTHPDWHPLAVEREMLARRFAGEPEILFRSESGGIFALEDRSLIGTRRYHLAFSRVKR
jgi:hypothetical protein